MVFFIIPRWQALVISSLKVGGLRFSSSLEVRFPEKTQGTTPRGICRSGY
jgi:hypothetical protein